jgi:hypothetical protein
MEHASSIPSYLLLKNGSEADFMAHLRIYRGEFRTGSDALAFKQALMKF